MTRLRHGNPPRREPDPAQVSRDPREPRGRLGLNELMQLAAIYEPLARQVQRKLERGAKVNKWDGGSLEYWERLITEISRQSRSN